MDKNKKNKIKWQELEREEKHYKDDRSSKGDRAKQPYKRDKNRVDWDYTEEYDYDFEDPYYGPPEDESN